MFCHRLPIYNHPAMKTAAVLTMIALACLTACSKPSTPAVSSSPAPSSSPASPSQSDPVQQKLLEYSGANATDCGRLDVRAAEPQLKAASGCAMQAAQQKHAFYVAYDMPGMSVGVAGNAEGKLFTVQSQGAPPAAALTSGPCPSPLRVASSGRISCFAPGDMGSMGGSHAAGAMPPAGMANPHGTGTANPHAASPPKTK
jgi:hypothetical protein